MELRASSRLRESKAELVVTTQAPSSGAAARHTAFDASLLCDSLLRISRTLGCDHKAAISSSLREYPASEQAELCFRAIPSSR
jgi:hypothetical protein